MEWREYNIILSLCSALPYTHDAPLFTAAGSDHPDLGLVMILNSDVEIILKFMNLYLVDFTCQELNFWFHRSSRLVAFVSL